MVEKLKYILLLLACIGEGVFLEGQQAERYLEVRGHAELDMNPLAGATATLFDGTTKVNSAQTNSDGSFSFKLEANKVYTVEVTKNGLITKKISFNTTIPDEESGIWVREFAIVLVPPCEGVDYSALQKPVDFIKFNPKRRDFESDKNYVDGMMPKLEEIYIKSANCLSDKYERLISQADKQFNQKTYKEARSTYQEALDIMPKEAYPKKKIGEIDVLLNQQKSNEDLYSKNISEADALMAKQQYAEALTQYKAASALKPQETYTAKKINEIQTIMAKQQADKQSTAATEAKYSDLVARANQAYGQKNYEMAKKYYQEALLIKPEAAATRNRIQEIEAIVAQQSQQQSKQKTLDDAYLAIVAQADALFKEKKFEAAKEAYAKALTMKPSESYPRAKTQEIDKAIQQMTQNEQNARRAELDRNLESYLEEGDNQFKAKNYDAARAAYANVLKIEPDEDYAKQRIAAIDKILVNEQASRQKTVEDGYKNAITQANTAVAQQQYGLAREQYQKALTFKPDDAFAKNKLTEVDKLIEEQNKNLAAAEIRDKQYKDAIASADRLYQAKDFQGAISGYRQALTIRPGDAYAQQRITGIENALAAEQASKQKATEDSYKNAIAIANTSLAQKQYGPAKEQYQKALSFKPDDAFAKSKIAEVDKLIDEQNKNLAVAEIREKQYKDAIASADRLYEAKDFQGAISGYRQALTIKPGDAYAQQRITGIENALAAEQASKQKATEDGYKNAIAMANTSLAQKQYEPAKEQYQKALAFKPDDAFAKTKIAEIDLLLKQEQDRLSAEQARKKQYDEAITRADKLFATKDYSNSRLAFEEASRVLPDESYPKQKISEVDKILADQQKALADKQAKDKAYNDAVKNGDMYFSLKSYNDARNEYNKALAFKPEEVYPKNKIAEIDNLIKAEQKVTADAKAKEMAYNEAVVSGNNAYTQKKYAEAKGFYNQALKIKPDDTYAKDQILLIDNLLAQMEKQKQADQAKQKQYDDLITLADKDFENAKYNAAKENYQKALAVLPDSPYPKQKIARIDEINKLLAQQEAKNTQPTNANQSGKQSIGSAAPLKQLNFKNDAERDVYLTELKRKYPEGITLEVYKEKYKETRRYVIVRDDVASEFRDVLIKTYGGYEYSMNGKTVTQMYYEQQVKLRPGEYYKETVFE